MATCRAPISPDSRPGQTPLLYPQQAIDPWKNRALPDYQINVLLLSTRPKNRTTVGVSIHMSVPSCHDGAAWPCAGALRLCICRQPPGKRHRLSK